MTSESAEAPEEEAGDTNQPERWDGRWTSDQVLAGQWVWGTGDMQSEIRNLQSWAMMGGKKGEGKGVGVRQNDRHPLSFTITKGTQQQQTCGLLQDENHSVFEIDWLISGRDGPVYETTQEPCPSHLCMIAVSQA